VCSSDLLGAAVADACGRELGRRYPRNALTRLRHLARHPDALVTDAVAAALVRLAEDSGLRGQVLDEVADWLRSPDVGRRQAAAAAFVNLAGMVDDRGVPILLNARAEGVEAGWRHVLGSTGGADGSGEAVRQAVNAWMDAGEAARAVLAEAAAGDSIASTALLRAVRAWAEGAADGETRWVRVAVMDALYERVVEEERRW